MRALVLDIFRLAARAGEVGLTASALAAIWGIECQRAADLRGVIDDMLRSGTLRVERGDRTVSQVKHGRNEKQEDRIFYRRLGEAKHRD